MSEYQAYAPANDSTQAPGPEGLLFTGDIIRSLTPEQVATIGEFANRMFGVEMRELREEVANPVPASRQTFLEFASETGDFSQRAAAISWLCVAYTGAHESIDRETDGAGQYASLHFLDGAFHEVVDLRSVGKRLVDSQYNPGAWRTGTKMKVKFLRSITAAKLH